MRVALIHSYYRSDIPSGENVVVDAQAKVLIEAGHEVQVIGRYSDHEIDKRLYVVKSAATVATGWGPSPLEQIEAFRPDVVHVHNLFPNFGTGWLKQVEVPLVATVHNFRPVCSATNLLRNGQYCDLCPTKGSHHAVLNSCYRNSKLATIPLAIATRKSSLPPVFDRADALIFLSNRSRAIYDALKMGIADKSRTIPNFIDPPSLAKNKRQSASTDPWVYVGRLSSEKGILELIRAWPENRPLQILGDGPLRKACEQASEGKAITFHGLVGRNQLFVTLNESRGLVFPSLWTEMYALVYLEACVAGLPTLALAGNSVADDVIEGATGVVFDSFESVEEGIATMEKGYERFSEAALKRFAERYSRNIWLQETVNLYEELVSSDLPPRPKTLWKRLPP